MRDPDPQVRREVARRIKSDVLPAMANVTISNVPGPNVALYFAGAKVLAYYPVSAVVNGQGLNMTVMSYRGNLYFGLIACRQLVPDLDVMAGFLRDELDSLTAAMNANQGPALAVG